MQHLYIGTYTQTGSEGIYICALDTSSGALRLIGTAPSANPSFLLRQGRHLYAVNELTEGAVASYAIDPELGALTPLSSQSSLGAHPCHLSIAGDSLLVANYSGGTVTALPMGADGALGPATASVQHEGAGPTERQKGPHPHSALQVAGFIYVPDLGLDQIRIYRLSSGELLPVRSVAVAPGAGPRHLAASGDGRFLYLANELDSTVVAFRRDEGSGGLEELQSLSTLPAEYDGINYPADLHLHTSGRFLYLSNREHDSIALFLVDGETGRLNPAGHFPAGGRWPRSFGIDPTGRFLVAAHQKGDTVVSFAIDPASGALAPTGSVLPIPAPVCVRF